MYTLYMSSLKEKKRYSGFELEPKDNRDSLRTGADCLVSQRDEAFCKYMYKVFVQMLCVSISLCPISCHQCTCQAVISRVRTKATKHVCKSGFVFGGISQIFKDTISDKSHLYIQKFRTITRSKSRAFEYLKILFVSGIEVNTNFCVVKFNLFFKCIICSMANNC